MQTGTTTTPKKWKKFNFRMKQFLKRERNWKFPSIYFCLPEHHWDEIEFISIFYSMGKTTSKGKKTIDDWKSYTHIHKRIKCYNFRFWYEKFPNGVKNYQKQFKRRWNLNDFSYMRVHVDTHSPYQVWIQLACDCFFHTVEIAACESSILRFCLFFCSSFLYFLQFVENHYIFFLLLSISCTHST